MTQYGLSCRKRSPPVSDNLGLPFWMEGRKARSNVYECKNKSFLLFLSIASETAYRLLWRTSPPLFLRFLQHIPLMKILNIVYLHIRDFMSPLFVCLGYKCETDFYSIRNMRLNESGLNICNKIILNANHETGKEDLMVRMKRKSCRKSYIK